MKKVLVVVLVMAYLIAFAANKTLEKTIGFDYDSTLAFSTPTFLAEKREDPSEHLDWDLINSRLLSFEKKKRVAALVTVTRIFGYTPIVVTARPEVKGDQFRIHVSRQYGVKPEDIYMTKEKSLVLKERNTVLFIGDSDGDITEAHKAGIRAIRIKRSADDQYKDHYHPGQYGEWVLPFSEAHE